MSATNQLAAGRALVVEMIAELDRLADSNDNYRAHAVPHPTNLSAIARYVSKSANARAKAANLTVLLSALDAGPVLSNEQCDRIAYNMNDQLRLHGPAALIAIACESSNRAAIRSAITPTMQPEDAKE